MKRGILECGGLPVRSARRQARRRVIRKQASGIKAKASFRNPKRLWRWKDLPLD